MTAEQYSRDEQARTFAQEILDTVAATLVTNEVEILIDTSEQRYTLRTARPGFPLFVRGRSVGVLYFDYDLSLDHTGTYLKVLQSGIEVTSEVSRTPLVRLDFRGDAGKEPVSHWQVHAESGPASAWLTRAFPDSQQPRKDYGLDRIWLPTGGERFRPCLEDVLEMLVVSLGVDHHDSWRVAVRRGRAGWRRRQLGAAVRDDPDNAARVLGKLGYTVTPPSELPPRREAQLWRW